MGDAYLFLSCFYKETPLDPKDAKIKDVLMENERLKTQVEAMRMGPPTPRTPRTVRSNSCMSLCPTPSSQVPREPAAGQHSPTGSLLVTPKATTAPRSQTVKGEAERGDSIAKELRNQDHGKLLEQFDLSSPDCG